MSGAGHFLPADARPPHDPLAMRLSARDGWRLTGPGAGLLDGVGAEGGDLRLDILKPAEPGLLEPLGSFGGIHPPVFVAWTPDGALYLLDRASGRVLWFDACACRFSALPCLGAAGDRHDPRVLERSLAIAASAGLLAVAGSTAHGGRVVVMGRRDLAPRHVLERDWEPVALAFDAHGGLYVADRKHGAVLRFHADGRHDWTRLPGVVYGLAASARGTLYMAGAAGALKYESGRADVIAFALDDMRGQFPPLPFRLDAKGRLLLGDLCLPPRAGALFGADGEPLGEAAAPWARALYRDTGRAVIGPLDSRIHACQWHRLAFDAALPPGTRLAFRTRCDEIEWPLADVADATDPAWSAPQQWRGPALPECLVASPPGRYLWLEITLAGDGAGTPSLATLELEFPRISLARYLPAVFVEQPAAADFTDRLLAIFDSGFRSVEARLDALGYLFDARSTPEAMLDWLASWIGLALPRGLPLARRRRLLRHMPGLYARRGTVEGMRQLLLLHLGLDLPAPPRPGAGKCGPACPPPARQPDPPRLILEHWRLRRWLFLDRGRLGESSRLWGESILNRSRLGGGMQTGASQIKLERDPLRDPFHAHAHAFSVFLPASSGATPAARRRVEALVAREAPAHAQAQVHWVRPNMRLGIQCALGFDTVIGLPREPAPQVGSARLNGDAPLPGAGGPTRHPGINIQLGYP
ncbi:MAG TPA: phage tail protein [Duganella sp.]|uniref:phage tail protein n=1 Tax=Duganella sp. TaxID=1904440 RepID=UPI002ED0ABCD